MLRDRWSAHESSFCAPQPFTRVATIVFPTVITLWVRTALLNALHHIFGPEAYADARTRVFELMAELNRFDDGRLVIDWT